MLFVSPECAPWVKTGGLGDVSAALPTALARQGHDVRVLMPAYPGVPAGDGDADDDDDDALTIAAAAPWPAARLRRVDGPGFALWLLECPSLYERDGGPYVDAAGRDHADNAARFGFLSHVAALLCRPDGPWAPWAADILHANDWTTGLAPAYLSLQARPRPASVFTVHNLAFQGDFDPSFARSLAVPDAWMNVDGLLHWGRLSMMKAGLRYADAVTTVSPTYAREVQSDPLGFGLDGMMRWRGASLHGILNGIDTEEWNPATDPMIAATFVSGQWARKAQNKKAVQLAMALEPDGAAMLFGMISRLTPQKGVDLVLDALDSLLDLGAQLVLLGGGDERFETQLLAAAAAHPGRVAVRVGFDEHLAHLIEAGADCFLMPSRFEPCGLNQMYSMAYGTPVLVHATGGLADTVTDADASREGTGFVMRTADADALRDALRRARAAYGNRRRWQALQRRGMQQRFGWDASTERYVALYRSLLPLAT